MTTKIADIEATGNGTTFSFVGLTKAGKQALRSDVSSESWQWLGRDTLVVDHRNAGGLINFLATQLDLRVRVL